MSSVIPFPRRPMGLATKLRRISAMFQAPAPRPVLLVSDPLVGDVVEGRATLAAVFADMDALDPTRREPA